MAVSSSRQRILCLWLDQLPVDRFARQSPDTPAPLVIYGKRGNAELIVALDKAAAALGLNVGLALAQARAMHPAITALPENRTADTQLLENIADWCLRYTPLVACHPPNDLLLDISGCAHLYGGEVQLVTDLATRLERNALSHRIAVADTIGAAYAAAHYGSLDIHASDKQRTFLAPLPIKALRIEPHIVAAMARVGLKCIGDILDLPRAPLTARFGSEVLRQLDRALGQEHEPLTPRLPVAPYVAEQRFADPIAREEDVLAVIEKLAGRLKIMLERRGDGARQIELALFRTDGVLHRISAGTSRPLLDPQEIRALFVERLAALADEYDPGFGFDMARVSIAVAEPCVPAQTGFGRADDAAALDRLVDHLSARLGAQRVRKLIAQDSHIPEIEAISVPAQSRRGDDGYTALRRDHAIQQTGPRPLRMLKKPEPIDAIAEIPDGPPLKFKWRSALHEVVAAEGPERIEGLWWSEDGGRARDYFRVEDKNGLRFWLFRSGLYRDLAQGVPAPTWFMHGTFA